MDPNLPNQTVTPEELQKIETELLEHILTNVESEKMTFENAQSLSREFLAALPILDKKDLVQKLNVLAKKYPEAQPAYLEVAAPYEEQERQRKLTEMAQHIQSGNIEHAITVAKGGTVV